MFTITIIWANAVHHKTYGLLQKKQFEEDIKFYSNKKEYRQSWLSDEKNVVFECDKFI